MKTKTIIFWIGEHAYRLYKMTQKSSLDEFKNVIILYSRNYAPEVSKNDPVYFLDEFYPLSIGEYSQEDLILPLGLFMKKRKLASEEALLIGDPSELLFQSALNGLEMTAIKFEDVEEELFNMAAYKNVTNKISFPDTSGMDVLFLPNSIPFKEDIENVEKQRIIAKKWFSNVMECKPDRISLDAFLFSYPDGLDKALENSKNISRI